MKIKLVILVGILIFINGVSVLISNVDMEKMTIKRFAFVVGANHGGSDRVKLRFAVSDAQALKNVLENMGGVLPEDTCFLAEPDPKKFYAEMDKLKQKVKKANSQYRRVEVIFYYSGHSDEENILLGDRKITYRRFRNLINNVDADVRIAILDSCASGAFTLSKGVLKRPSFLVDKAFDMKGYAIMTSSSSHEAAQESNRLKASFFTHYLLSGLRGAADMNEDGRITLNEAYQFAFDETLSKTENTMGGPQHPNYNIQMSGTGDVVMTDIRRSSVVLDIDKNISGKIFIHNESNVLVVELTKPFGRNIEIGLEPGKYRIINISEGRLFEANITLELGSDFLLKRKHFNPMDKLETKIRGDSFLAYIPQKLKKKKRFSVEMYGGFSTLDPKDLNLRSDHQIEIEDFYINQCFDFYKRNGGITAYSITRDGEYLKIKNAFPLGMRIRYDFSKAFSLFLGIEYMKSKIDSSIEKHYTYFESSGKVTNYGEATSPYQLWIEGLVPHLGFGFKKKISRLFSIEGYLAGGPIFARCGYFLEYEEQKISGGIVPMLKPDYLIQYLNEEGSGTGVSLRAGLRLNVEIFHNLGIFAETAYVYQMVKELSGSGSNDVNNELHEWKGEWGIKERFYKEEWGTLLSHWPSNSWDGEAINLWCRKFNLDLSGFQAKIGVYFRFL